MQSLSSSSEFTTQILLSPSEICEILNTGFQTKLPCEIWELILNQVSLHDICRYYLLKIDVCIYFLFNF
jgi:hypothetical protein